MNLKDYNYVDLSKEELVELLLLGVEIQVEEKKIPKEEVPELLKNTKIKLEKYFLENSTDYSNLSVVEEMLEWLGADEYFSFDDYDDNEEYDGDYITKTYVFDIDRDDYTYTYTRSSYIKDHSICDSEFDNNIQKLVLKTNEDKIEEYEELIKEYENKIEECRVKIDKLKES